MISTRGRIAYSYVGPLGASMRGLGDAPASATAPGFWESKWQSAVDQFKSVWAAFTASKSTLAVTQATLDSIDPTQIDASKLQDWNGRAENLSLEEGTIDGWVQAAVNKIHDVENSLGWNQTQLGIFGIDDAIVIAGVVTAGVAAVGYYVYKITTHTEDVNQLATELQAIGKGVISPAQLVALQNAQAASSGGGTVLGDIMKQVLPYVAIGLAGYLVFGFIKGKGR
jgi:hypothetical protein